MNMKEIKDREFKIEAKGEIPFASKISSGYEFISNDRTMKFIIRKSFTRNLEQNIEKVYFLVDCFVREGIGWVKGNNSSAEQSIDDFVRKINISPRFTRSVDEYRKQLNITEEWR